MNLFHKLLKQQTPAEEFHAAEAVALENYEMLRRAFALVGEEQKLSAAVWAVRNWLKGESNRSDEDVLTAARTSVAVALNVLCSNWPLELDEAADFITRNPEKVLGLMKMGAEHAKKHDPGFAARYDRSLQYLNSKPQEA